MGVLVSHSILLRASETVSDADLVARAAGGDRWSREMIYRRHAGLLLAIAARLLGNRGDAEEVVQDTFVTAFEQLRALRDPAALRAWLAQIAVSLVRRRIRRGRLMRVLGLDRGADDATLAALAAPGTAPDERADLAMVDRLLAKLRANVRIAWMLRRVEGLELAEVASYCGCSLATAKRWIAEADGVIKTPRQHRGGCVVSRLRLPLKQGLREPADEATLSRIWQGIDARYPRPRWRRRIELVAAPVVAVAALAAVVTVLRHDAGPLRLASGAAIAAVDAPATGARMSLSDGSYIVLGGGARLEPLESSGSTFIAIVARGNATFDVRPGGPRRWQIECGLATVEVVGTHFDVERSPGRLRVAVARGQVLVRGERVPDRVRRLAAGEALEVTDATAAVVPARPSRRRRPRTRRAMPTRPMRRRSWTMRPRRRRRSRLAGAGAARAAS